MKRIANEVGSYSFFCVTQGVLHHTICHEHFPVYKPPTFPLSPSFSFFYIDTSILRWTVYDCWWDTIHYFLHLSFMMSLTLSNTISPRRWTLPSTTHLYSMILLSHITFYGSTSYKNIYHRTLWCTFSRFSALTCHSGSQLNTVSGMLVGSSGIGCYTDLEHTIMPSSPRTPQSF